MDWTFIIVLFCIGFAGAFVSGMVGIGGAIVNFPMLLYIPPLLGFTAFTSHQVSGISAVQVLFSTIGGVLVYRKGGYLNKKLIAYMGTSILLGSFVGSYGSHMLPEKGINLVYGILAIVAVILMLLPKKGIDDVEMDQLIVNRWLAISLSFMVGISAGIVGAGGSFILIPIMLTILKIPTRVTIASSLAITLISSVGVTVGKVSTGQVDLLPTVIVVIASLMASPLGAKMGKQMNSKVLQDVLSIIIGLMALKVWISIIQSLI